jgi:hypothetical protein
MTDDTPITPPAHGPGMPTRRSVVLATLAAAALLLAGLFVASLLPPLHLLGVGILATSPACSVGQGIVTCAYSATAATNIVIQYAAVLGVGIVIGSLLTSIVTPATR